MSRTNEVVSMTYKELDSLTDELDRLRAANARLQAWHDAVMKRGSVGYWHQDLKEGFTKHDVLGAQPLIIRPQPLAKE